MTSHDATLLELLSGWLRGQRWFPARGEEFGLRQVGAVPLAEPAGEVGLVSLLLAVDPGPSGEGAAAGRPAVVHLPLSFRRTPLAGAADGGAALDEAEAALIGLLPDAEALPPETGVRGGGPWFVYDGAHDPAFIAAWLEAIRTSASAEGFEALPYAGFEGRAPFAQPLAASVLAGEQSNTSVVVESPQGPLILKFFRVPAPGENPDVELGTLLSTGGSREVPETLGCVNARWAAGDGQVQGAVSVLREFIPGSQDAWRTASSAALAGRDFTVEAEQLGRATARLHGALRDVAGTVPATAGELAAFVEALRGRIVWGWQKAGAAVGPLEGAFRTVLAGLEGLSELPPLQRIHGDYHLGQVLHASDRGWVVLDFEGEPLRSAEERTVRDIALRDVVGMLRSFDYAAGVALQNGEGGEAAERAVRNWAADARLAFLAGYEAESGTLLETSSPLFLALLLDKALYEVVYELQNRPAWVEVPAAGVREILAPFAGNDGASAGHGAAASGAAVPAADASEPVEAVPPAAPAPSAEPSPAGQAAPAPPSYPDRSPRPAPPARPEEPSVLQPSTHAPLPVAPEVLAAVAHGSYHAPHAVLGAHLDDFGFVTVRTLRKLAKSVSVVTAAGKVPMQHEHHGVWVAVVPTERPMHVPDFRLEVEYEGAGATVVDEPYKYLPTLGEIDLHLIGEGRHEKLWAVLGSHVRRYHSAFFGDTIGTSFAVWAPNAQAVRVKGDFNNWDGSVHAMRSLGHAGVWEVFIPGVPAGAVYKYEILGKDGHWRDKADPMARCAEVPPLTGSVVVESEYGFQDEEWMAARAARDPHNSPMSVYEVHLGSWRPGLTYRQLADQLTEYVSWQGFTHVELMPVAEHPFGGSWGYQVTGYFAPTSRFGHPDDFRYLVDKLHQAGIGVLLDWVPAHFPKDDWALARFDGEPLYEHADPRQGEHPDWGTLIFDFGRNEVRNFLVANALYWLEEFHIDGLRVDAVASMLYLDYSREDGQWIPNEFGGRENLAAIRFLQEACATAYRRAPGAVMIAEESTAFDGVTRPTASGGLGFGLKWNMGWMHDTLQYMQEDPVNRMYHHHKMTFSMVYAWTENFLLPISHDEVVHGKGSMLRKMPGDRWRQLANVRAYLAYQWAHPGKQLVFMGTEFAQESEWNESYGLDWWLAETPQHAGVQKLVRQLNSVYRESASLWELDNDPAGFQWIDGNDGAGNTFSFIRRDKAGRPLVCVANFSGEPHTDVRLGLPAVGTWNEILNTDALEYGGSGVDNGGAVDAVAGEVHGQPAHAVVTLPPLGVVYFTPAD